jgi:hypothetical protein
VELDLHPHGAELQAYIGDVTGRRTVPNVHVKGITRGGGDEFRKLHHDGNLEKNMQDWGGNSFRIKKLSPPSGS